MKKTITLTDEIAEVERELIMRKSFYQKQIESGRMTREKANWQYQVLGRVLARLKKIQAQTVGNQETLKL